MNKYATVIGIAFILVAVFSAVTLALTVDRYGAFAETKNEITVGSGNVYIKEVRVPPVYNMDEVVRVTILVEVNNPSRLDIWVYNIEFSLYMFNRTTMAYRDSYQVMEPYYVMVGGFFRYNDPAYLVPSGGNATLESSLAVTSPYKLAILNTTDPDDGKYRPLVYADLRYEIVDLDALVPVHGLRYFDTEGVDPYLG